MPDPSTYTRGYSFSDWQATNPSRPLPGPALDAELNNASIAVTALVNALKDVRRPDGRLKNGSVTKDALAPAVVASIGSDDAAQALTDFQGVADQAEAALADAQTLLANTLTIANLATYLGHVAVDILPSDLDNKLGSAAFPWTGLYVGGGYLFQDVVQSIGVRTGGADPNGKFFRFDASGNFTAYNGEVRVGTGSAGIKAINTADLQLNPGPGGVVYAAGSVLPLNDADITVGTPVRRWNDIFLMNQPTVTSDSRLKTEVSISDAVLRAVYRVQARAYLWKGEPNGPIHYGYFAQDVVAELEREGVVPSSHGFIMFEEAAGYALRYQELEVVRAEAARRVAAGTLEVPA